MADSSGRVSGKPSVGGPSTPAGAKPKGRRTQGGKVVESRYLQYEKKTTKKAPVAGALKPSGKKPEGGRKPNPLQKSKESSGVLGKGDLQSTLLEGHGAAPPDLDLSAINDKSVIRKTLQLEKTLSKKTESTSLSTSQKKNPDLSESMERMESQTLLLTLLSVQIENSVAAFEEKAERDLLTMCQEKERLQKKAYELKRKLLLCQRKRELADVLDAQIEMLSPYKAVAERFKEQYKTFATALDTTRHKLPVRSVHLDGDEKQFLDDLQQELTTTRHLLGELGVCGSEENGKVLDLLGELKEMTQKKDLELRRSFAQVLELSAGASKEAALVNQEVWEEAQGPAALCRWYFTEPGPQAETQGEASSPPLSG
ncbi:HAUS augmin like complex subunit 8 [Phyllostomus discolor]|uniref:HAUS augmin like complex subunit 8 n=1 Tax=Phyllostomus discolor TaxID=89673 RepID=A0A6J2MBE2_9CHIR|nr:HAUS augmin-like complex subunit 8 isoform X2 [Phyllostomus discolor]KAF6094098.1 HAUS augmin like complex subunit 8 [Phyllostomus discolor]